MAWEENSCISLNMQLIAILSRIGVYTSLLNDYAERNLGREHYEFIARVLSCIRKLNGGQAVVKSLVAEFRIKYKRRPAMMEVLGKF